MIKNLFKLTLFAITVTGMALFMTSCSSSDSFSDNIFMAYVIQENDEVTGESTFTPYVAYEVYGNTELQSGTIKKDGEQLSVTVYAYPGYSAILTTGKSKFQSVKDVEGPYSVEAVDTKGKIHLRNISRRSVGVAMGVMGEVEVTYVEGELSLVMESVEHADLFGFMIDLPKPEGIPDFWHTDLKFLLKDVPLDQVEEWSYSYKLPEAIDYLLDAYEELTIYPVATNGLIVLRGAPLIMTKNN